MKQYPVQEDQNVTSHHSQTILNTSILYSPFLQAAITSHLFPGKYCVPIFHIPFVGALKLCEKYISTLG